MDKNTTTPSTPQTACRAGHSYALAPADTGLFGNALLDYINNANYLKNFWPHSPCTQGATQWLQTPPQNPHRNTLASVLQQQYAHTTTTQAVLNNINILKQPNTYTVTTGHQLQIFGGPLFFAYKIISTISTVRYLQQQHPQFNFVPVFWMASEDHDVDEISRFNLFGTAYQWPTNQTGPTGRLSTEGLQALAHSLPEAAPLFKQAYTQHHNLADATRYWVNQLFGQYGLVCLDADDAQLKACFAKTMASELEQPTTQKLVEKQSEALQNNGYKAQAYARPVNLFYFENNQRLRIDPLPNGGHALAGTNQTFAPRQLAQQALQQPHRFSPNVILRPLYQETILPNMAYIGGPAEVAYWLQLKTVFAHYNLPTPLLLPRHFAMVVPNGVCNKITKNNFTPTDLFKDFYTLKLQYLSQHAEQELNATAELNLINQGFDMLANKATQVEPSLEKSVRAAATNTLKTIEKLTKKIRKAEENKHQTALRQIEAIKEKLFPEGKPQERHSSLLDFYQNDNDFIEKMLNTFEAFKFDYHVVIT